MSKEDLRQVVETEEEVQGIWNVRADIVKYKGFEDLVEAGFHIGINDLPFEKAVLYSWIKEVLKRVRKTNN